MTAPNIAEGRNRSYSSDEVEPTEIAMKEGQLNADEFNRRYPDESQAPIIEAVPETVHAQPIFDYTTPENFYGQGAPQCGPVYYQGRAASLAYPSMQSEVQDAKRKKRLMIGLASVIIILAVVAGTVVGIMASGKGSGESTNITHPTEPNGGNTPTVAPSPGPKPMGGLTPTPTHLRTIAPTGTPKVPSATGPTPGTPTVPGQDSTGDIRLALTEQGTGAVRGRPEVFDGYVWGRICDDNFDVKDAAVACRQLGYSSIDPIVHGGIYNDYSTGFVMMDEMQCTGSEDRLVDCAFPGYDVVNCEFGKIVEITCNETDPQPMPTAGGIRLASKIQGTGNVRGRPEVFDGYVWGRVCDDNFDVKDAAVACRQLGYSSIDPIVHGGIYSDYSTGFVMMDEMQCTGSEDRLVDCVFPGYDVVSCEFGKIVEITCNEANPSN